MAKLISTLEPRPLSGGAQDALWCLFKNGPTWDGDIPSKVGRDELIEAGYAERFEGWSFLKFEGITLALDQGMGRKKESRR
jgi:hypothetical protein